MNLKIIPMLWTSLRHVAGGVLIGSLLLVSSNGQTHKAKQTDKAAIRKRIAAIISDRLKEGLMFPNNGSPGSPVYTRVPPSREAVKEVKEYGDNALPVLSEHLQSKNERERGVAVELIGLVGGYRMVVFLQRVIQNDAASHIRILAIRWITQAPPSLALPIIRKAARTDVDESVRKAARDILEPSIGDEVPGHSAPFKVVPPPF
jgi:hypothetical protein